AFVQERRHALARGELSRLVLLRDALRTARERGLRLHVFEAPDRVVLFHAAYSRQVANVKGSALASRVLWVELGHGGGGMERLLAQCSPELRASLSRGIAKAQWYPFEQFVELNIVIDRVFGRGDLGLVRQL